MAKAPAARSQEAKRMLGGLYDFHNKNRRNHIMNLHAYGRDDPGSVRAAENAVNAPTLGMYPASDAFKHPRPIVSLVGQFSVGKTTALQHILGAKLVRDRVGQSATTNTYRIIVGVHGLGGQEVLHASTCNSREVNGIPLLPGQLQALADMNLDQSSALVECVLVDVKDAPILEHITFVDSPGVLQKADYNRHEVMQAVVDASDLVVLLLDVKVNDMGE